MKWKIQGLHTQVGLTLTELMIVVSLIAILASIAVPAYGQYLDRTKYSEVMLAARAARAAVDICAQFNNATAHCSGMAGNAEGIPEDVLVSSNRYVASVTTVAGVITVVPKAIGGVSATDTYILRATAAGGNVAWTIDPASGCLAKGLCEN